MKNFIPFFLIVLVSTPSTLGQYPPGMYDYAEWVSVGMPDSWCYPRQCHGDADGKVQGPPPPGWWVYTNDLALVATYWKKPWPVAGPNQLCADFDHRRAGSPFTGYWRVGASDVCKIKVWFGLGAVPVDCQTPPIPPTIPDTAGSQLSFQISREPTPNPADFYDPGNEITLVPGQKIWIGIINTTPDILKWYDAFVIMTGALECGSWTGENWCYSDGYGMMGWTYYGTPEEYPDMDIWFAAVSYPSVNTNEDPEGVSAAVQYQQDSGGCVTILLYNEFFDEVIYDGLTICAIPIQLSSPNGGEKLFGGDEFLIQWDSDDYINNVKVEYSINGGSDWQEVDPPNTGNTGSYNWLVPKAESEQCLVRVSDANEASRFDVSDSVFRITIRPAITVIEPNGGENLAAANQYTIRWESAGDINDVAIEFSDSNGLSWSYVTTSTPDDGSYEWDPIADANSNRCLMRISDVNNTAVNDTSDTNFTVFQCTWQNYADLNGDCYVDFEDLALFTLQWLKCGNPFDEACY
jgi:hypothetical protein